MKVLIRISCLYLRKGLVFVAAFCASTCFLSTQGYGAQASLQPKQKERAELFLKLVLIDQYGLYTLVGSKPMTAFTLIPVIDETEKHELYLTQSDQFRKKISLPKYRPSKQDALKLWRDWKEVERFFLGNQFLIQVDGDWEEGILINKLSATYILEKYRSDFEKYFGESFNADKALLLIGDNQSVIWSKLKKDHYLLGLLFGFGEKNAFSFALEKKRGEYLPQRKSSSVSLSSPCLPLQELQVQDLGMPAFISYELIDHQLEKYQVERDKIIQLYQGKDFYEFTSQILQGKSPITPQKEVPEEKKELIRKRQSYNYR